MRITILLLLMVLLGGCTKRYWFRTKIDTVNSKKYSVKITVINQSPEFLSDQFVEVMRKSSMKELKRKGYFELPIDSPQFHFVLTLKVDSFNAGVRNFTKNTAVYSTTPSRNYYTFRHTVKAILFNCEMRNYKQGWLQWEAEDDLYYFGEERDLGRSVGMVRHLIKTVKPRE